MTLMVKVPELTAVSPYTRAFCSVTIPFGPLPDEHTPSKYLRMASGELAMVREVVGQRTARVSYSDMMRSRLQLARARPQAAVAASTPALAWSAPGMLWHAASRSAAAANDSLFTTPPSLRA